VGETKAASRDVETTAFFISAKQIEKISAIYAFAALYFIFDTEKYKIYPHNY
jgi:hypothetical protein